MYLDFYHLQKAPFHITPDPEFLFLSPSHKAALGCIIHGIEERQGFVAISGEVGLGKTTILRSYLERVDPSQLKTIYIFNANVSFHSLLKTLLGEFGIEPETEDVFEMVNRLHHILIEAYQQGRNVALIIDEAQNMPIETLENLRMLSNLETNTEKLIQITMIGQPEFDHKLNLNELRQLKQRIVIRSTIEPLTAEESLAYIQHRLAKASSTNAPVFSKGALKTIAQAAKGTPRILNILCTNALIAGFGYRQKPISVKTTKQVIADFQGNIKTSRRQPKLAVAVGMLACAGLLWALPYRDQLLDKVVPAQYLGGTSNHVQGGPKTSTSPTPATQHNLNKPLLQVKYDGNHTNGHVLQPHVVTPIDTQPATNAAPPTVHDVGVEPSPESSVQDESQATLKTSKAEMQASLAPETPQQKSRPVFPIIKTVHKGDYVSVLASEIYGFSNSRVIKILTEHNPQIKDLNKVKVGDRIIFPDLSAYAISTE